jgi:hypothetical protein
MGKGLKVYLAALTQGIFTIKVADMAAAVCFACLKYADSRLVWILSFV